MSFRSNFLSCLSFWSRVPVGTRETLPPFAIAVSALPIAAVVIALPAALTLAASLSIGAPSLVAALLAFAILALLTGALHEDGLADCADALAGTTPERRLAIMKDSRNGTFGTLALIFSVFFRVAAVAALAQTSVLLGCLGLLAAAVVSRVACLTPLALLPPARADGAGFAAGAPDPNSLRIAMVGAILGAALPLLAGAAAGVTVLAALAAAAAAFFVTSQARRKLGGQTGDVAGAAQQLAEISYLVVLSVAA